MANSSTTTSATSCCDAPHPEASRASSLEWLASTRSKLWVYLALIAALYVSVAVYAVATGSSLWAVLLGRGFEHAAPGEGVLGVLATVWLTAGEMLTELLPYWLIGMLLAGTLMGLATWEKIARWLRSGGIGASAMAAGTGAAIPICSCGMAPLLGGMTRAGVPLGPAMAFVIAAPMINVPAVLLTGGALGPGLATARVLGTLAIAMLAATLFGWWARRNGGVESLLRLGPAPSGSSCGATQSALDASVVPASESRTVRVLGSAARLFLQMNAYLLLAVAISGLIRAVVPAEWIAASVGGEGVLSVVFAAAAASVLYLCTYTEVPTAAALVDLGMGPGATLAYLLVGPGVSLPSLALLSAVFRPKLLAAYAVFAFTCAVIAGTLFNLLVG